MDLDDSSIAQVVSRGSAEGSHDIPPTKKISVVGNVPVDSEAPVVTSSISLGFAGSVFEDAHMGRVCVRVFIGVSAHAL